MRNLIRTLCLAVAWLSAWAVNGQQGQLQTAKRILDDRQPGVLGIARRSVGSNEALSELAQRYGEVILIHHSLSAPHAGDHTEASTVVELPDSVRAIDQLAALCGSTIVRPAPGFALLAPEASPADVPIYLTAERAIDIRGDSQIAIGTEDFEHLLFVYRSPIWTTIHSVYSHFWFGMHYWPSREGGGRQVYVLTHSTGQLHPKGIPSRGLTKYTIDSSSGAVVLREQWGCAIQGPVTDLELDFDDDGVIDVVAFSGLEGNEVGTTPLVIVSGRTGERLGEIEGDELVVTRSATGVKVRTLGTRQDVVAVGDSTYWVETRIQRLYVLEEGELSLAWEREEPGYCALGGPLEPRTGPRDFRVPDIGRPRAADKPLLRPKRETEDLASLAPGERLLAHVLVADARVLLCFDRGPWHGIAALRRVGEQILWPGKDAPELANARILFEYHPPKPEEHHEP